MELANATQALHDESIGTATRFVYYHFRCKKGKQIDPSVFSQLVISAARRQYGINSASVDLAASQLVNALAELSIRWQKSPYLVGDRLRVEDIAAALLSPLALIPQYHQEYSCLFESIVQHQLCGEPLPPGWGQKWSRRRWDDREMKRWGDYTGFIGMSVLGL